MVSSPVLLAELTEAISRARFNEILARSIYDQVEQAMGAVNLADAKTHLSELVSKAERGVETVITRRGRPVARLVPIAFPKRAFRSLAKFRATLPMARTSSADVIRQMRDEGY